MASTLLLLVSLQQGAAAASLTCPLDIKSKTVSTVEADSSSSSSTSSSSSKSSSGSDSNSASGSDSNSDSGSDSNSDSGSDSNSDSGSDSNSDSGSNSNSDSGSDSTSDSGSDSTSDSGSDSNSDSGSDSTSDSGSDSNSASESTSGSDSASASTSGSSASSSGSSSSASASGSGSSNSASASTSGSSSSASASASGSSAGSSASASGSTSSASASSSGSSNSASSAGSSGASSTSGSSSGSASASSNTASASSTGSTTSSASATSSASSTGSTTSSASASATEAPTTAPSSASSTDASASSSATPTPTSASSGSAESPTTAPASTTASSSAAESPTTAPTSSAAEGSTDSTTAPTPTSTTASSGGTAISDGMVSPASETPTTTTTPAGGSTSGRRLEGSSNSSTTRQLASSSSSGSSGLTAADEFVCDEDFYSQWDTLNLKCGGSGINVASAVAAASCVIYSGTVGSLAGSTCVSVCSFPACESGSWVYGADNGIASAIYDSVQLTDFMTSAMKTHLSSRTSAAASFLANTTIDSTQQCAFSSEASFDSCDCAADSVSTLSSDEAAKLAREEDEAYGIITQDATSSAGSVIAPVAETIAVVTVVLSAVAAMAGTLASGAGASAGMMGGAGSTSTGASAVASASTIMATIDLCQFSVFMNEVNLDAKSAVLSIYGKQMAPAAFAFLPFGKLDTSSSSSSRRLTELKTPDSAVASYSRTLHVDENWLFVVTLAGVGTILVAIVVLFGIAYVVSGFFMARDEFYEKFANRVIGVLLMVVILAQNTIGVTATYEIYHSFSQHDGGNWKCILAIASLLFIAIGIIFYGYIVVKRHEEDLADVGEETHAQKRVCQRYGVLYGDYKFKSRYFFAAKMMLSLVSGMVVGYVGASAYVQIGISLAAQVVFTLYLEVESPHLESLAQKTNTCASIVKIAVLILGFFLIEVKTADGSPTVGQNRISMVTVCLQIVGLLIIVSRSAYPVAAGYFEKRKEKDEQQIEDFYKLNQTPML